MRLNDIQAFADPLTKQGYADASQRQRLHAIKSLLTYGYDLGVLARNVGRSIKPPRAIITIAERILSEQQVLSILSQTPTVLCDSNFNPRLLGRVALPLLDPRIPPV